MDSRKQIIINNEGDFTDEPFFLRFFLSVSLFLSFLIGDAEGGKIPHDLSMIMHQPRAMRKSRA